MCISKKWTKCLHSLCACAADDGAARERDGEPTSEIKLRAANDEITKLKIKLSAQQSLRSLQRTLQVEQTALASETTTSARARGEVQSQSSSDAHSRPTGPPPPRDVAAQSPNASLPPSVTRRRRVVERWEFEGSSSEEAEASGSDTPPSVRPSDATAVTPLAGRVDSTTPPKPGHVPSSPVLTPMGPNLRGFAAGALPVDFAAQSVGAAPRRRQAEKHVATSTDDTSTKCDGITPARTLRARLKVVNYTEPSLRTKMRRPGPTPPRSLCKKKAAPPHVVVHVSSDGSAAEPSANDVPAAVEEALAPDVDTEENTRDEASSAALTTPEGADLDRERDVLSQEEATALMPGDIDLTNTQSERHEEAQRKDQGVGEQEVSSEMRLDMAWEAEAEAEDERQNNNAVKLPETAESAALFVTARRRRCRPMQEHQSPHEMQRGEVHQDASTGIETMTLKWPTHSASSLTPPSVHPEGSCSSEEDEEEEAKPSPFSNFPSLGHYRRQPTNRVLTFLEDACVPFTSDDEANDDDERVLLSESEHLLGENNLHWPALAVSHSLAVAAEAEALRGREHGVAGGSIDRRRRSLSIPSSYKEPSLRAKMRRPD